MCNEAHLFMSMDHRLESVCKSFILFHMHKHIQTRLRNIKLYNTDYDQIHCR